MRKYDDKGAPPFKVLKEGENPPLDAYDNFVIGPKYVPAPERKKVEGVPEGKVQQFEIDSKDTKLFNPGIKREKFGKVDPKNPKTLIVETHNIDYKRKVGVYIPAQYKEGTEAPFMVVHDGPGQANGYKTILDNLIAPEADSADHPHRHRKRRRRRPGARARQGVRQHERRLRHLHRGRGAAARGEELQGEADQGPRRPRGDGLQFRRLVRAHHGVVPQRPVPPRADHLGHVREPGVAVRPQVPRRRLGLPRDADPEGTEEADPHLHLRSATRICSTRT